jgi:hypothetical protein
MGRGRDAIPVSQRRPAGHEQSHDLGVGGAAVAQDHGFQQGRPTEVVDLVDVMGVVSNRRKVPTCT